MQSTPRELPLSDRVSKLNREDLEDRQGFMEYVLTGGLRGLCGSEFFSASLR